ncbi:phosphate/phosphite/phosphonate ABC transporter substrate-binding protein [Thiovibrio frasassiensis]|uniref:Phosphate/phosphite/phosphonate ABC transporter substrate-binding protein n=1 Tax=Thiovibrio frasassiensis TaxID=2984131 RepID=A0A9X4MFV3_9BACT|nr:phosphate/phosphite/phosphonate ABC transporter substrate-binding protein [Thiovibrio frasassiensis]MDG4475623.1 phosphate/phosphite/phosphonate ABC transporter substrate-binding protein [Thiovibrio frasassiensis]
MRLCCVRDGIRILLCGFFLLFWAGCSDEQSAAPASASPPSPAPATKIVIGLIPEMDIFVQKKRYEPIARYLSQKTGAQVELKILSRYGNILNNFQSEGLDGAFFGSFTGALAIKRLGVEPLARPEYEGGVSSYYGMVFARKDSGIKTARDVKGKVFVFVDKATTAGWLLPLYFFRTLGIADYRAWFRETYFSGTHEDAIHDVLSGKADLGAAKDLVFNRLAKEDPRIAAELNILTTSPAVPANTLAVRHDLDPALKKVMQTSLLAMDQDAEGRQALVQFGASRFIETRVQDYQPVIEYAKRIGLDLATYDYVND